MTSCCCCCCCCPPPIQGLLNLYIRSGCSKSTVAAALTFFPPSPPLYTFERLDKNGKVLTEEDDLNKLEEDDFNDIPDLESELHLNTSNGNNRAGEMTCELQKDENPMTKLVEQNKLLQRKANFLYKRDKCDVAKGVTYRFIPDPRLRSPPSFSGKIEALKIHCPKSKSYVAALLYRADLSENEIDDKPVRTIIYSHGNAADIGSMNVIQCIIARSLKVNVLMYDYSGYGESGGMVREQNTCYDLEAVYMYTVEHIAKGCPQNIILYGQSVGSGPVCYVGSRKPSGGIILHSAFLSGMRVLTPNRALACLDIYPNIVRIKKVKCPVFIIHGLRDEEVSAHHGIGLHEAVKQEYRFEPWWIADRGHNDICDGAGRMQQYVRRIGAFLDAVDNFEIMDGSLERGKVKLMRRA